MELIDKADCVAPDRGSCRVRQHTSVAAFDKNRAAIRPFQQPGQMQQRRLARTGRCSQRDDFARTQCQVDAAEHRQFAGFSSIDPLHTAQNQRITHA